jgi:NAD(P)-dependent dehydrogenase (short-subunit alcohol dehydrogenase family)
LGIVSAGSGVGKSTAQALVAAATVVAVAATKRDTLRKRIPIFPLRFFLRLAAFLN